MSVRRWGREAGNSWAVFALANTGDEQIDRLIVVPHYRMVGSGLFGPDLGLSRVVTVTPSAGERPERQDSATADVFRITLDPGSVITYVLELRSDKLPPSFIKNGVATISTTVAAIKVCEPAAPQFIGVKLTSRPVRSRTKENSPICASIRATDAAIGNL